MCEKFDKNIEVSLNPLKFPFSNLLSFIFRVKFAKSSVDSLKVHNNFKIF